MLTEPMIDEIVAEAIRSNKKKIAWQQEQETAAVSGRHTSTSTVGISKDTATFVPPNGMK